MFTTPEARYGPIRLGLAGEHQAQNAALAVRAAEVALAEVARRPLAPEAARRGLRDVAPLAGLRGRAEAWAGDPRIVLDVAHNADGWRAALRAVEVASGGRLWVLVGAMADKDVSALGPLLAARDALVMTVGLGGERAFEAEPLAARLREGGARAEPVADVAAALARFGHESARGDRLLITGSHLTVAAALAALAGPKNARTSEHSAG